jgi:flagellar biosynthesis protein FlhG
MALTVSEALSVGSAPRRRQIWSVGGGKGGIGKSLIAASLGWQLARMGQRVVVIDADLGGANLHTCLGLPVPVRTLADFIQRRLDTLEEALTETGVPGLRLLSGAADLLNAANIKHMQKVRVLRKIRALDVDVVLIDIGAGTSFNILDFFLISDVSILTVSASKHERTRRLVEAALDPKNEEGLRTPVDLVERVEREDVEEAAVLRREMSGFRPRFVVNEVRDDRDVAIGHQLVAACHRHLGLQASYAGYVHFEDAVWQSVRRRRLFMADAPTSRAAEEIRRLTRGLLKGESLGAGY